MSSADWFGPIAGPPRDFGEGATSFAGRYGPWALIAGASDGLGAALARQVAGRVLNVVLVSIDGPGLESVAASISTQTRAIVQDLSKPEAAEALIAACAGIEIGLFSYVSGIDPHQCHFLSKPIDAWEWVVERNVLTMMRLTHHFTGKMVERGSGGVIIMSSGAGYTGAANLGIYTATKGFGLRLAESLWIETRAQGVDVLGAACPTMDTPSYRRLFGTPPAGYAADPDDVARHLIENIDNGPSYPPVQANADLTRREAVEMMSRGSTKSAALKAANAGSPPIRNA